MKPDIAARLNDLTRPTGTEDLLDVEYPTPRFTISLRHAAIVAGVAALGLSGWFLLYGDTDDPATITALAQQPTSSAAPGDSGIVVSVLGHVHNPGLQTLPPGARVADALAAAGALPDAELTTLNLAQILEDGVQIVVLAQGATPAVVGGGGEARGLISLNNASVTDLVTLPGVGEKTAQAIVSYRDSSGGFSTVDELLNVKGIGPSKFEQIAGLVTP